MTTLLGLLAAFAVLLTAVAVVRSGSGTSPGRPDDAGGAWLDRTRRLLADAARLRTEVDALNPTLPLTEADDEALETLSDGIAEFCADAAAVSAVAPTAMDGRVVRNLAVRARMVGDLFEREIRLREVCSGMSRPVAPGEHGLDQHLHEFEVAVSDLRTHVELL